ncbi:MAG TPA: D-alanyl-D-alanine carboxypeptidase/D-alanyl-D-alanine-endopeptidase [Acidimicrobiia bacterium]|nr:D-alanyl-D-alanine carboxypeptidase/D-alanyl-D-alanine-endopeptidase [Acidimicrobiia bacterium]
MTPPVSRRDRRVGRSALQARWRRLSVVLAIAALACVAVAAIPSSGGGSGGGSLGALGTPVWSARRAPELVVDAVGAQRLQASLTADLAGDPGSCFVVSEGAEPLAALNPTAALLPASTEKLLTATAALATLGPNFKYETKVVSDQSPDSSGTLDRLWLVGAGDPVLATANYVTYLQSRPEESGFITTSLESLADAIVAKGVKRIPGGIIGDDSRYDAQRYVPSWESSYRTDPQIGPLGALTVNGGYQVQGTTRLVPVPDPALYAATELTTLLKARGVQVGSPSAHTKAPAGATPITSIFSPTLHDILVSTLERSDNLAAELLAKEMGVHASGQGTTAAGTQVITTTLTRLGMPTAGLALNDASGLDRGDRLSCTTLAAVLNLAQTPQFQTILQGLPVAGQLGTLADRLAGTPLAGKLKAKTGTLNGVSSLAGLLAGGRPLQFALLVNGNVPDKAAADAVRERFAGILATFPNAPAAAALVPAPAPGH